VALDVDPEAARRWIEKASPDHPTLFDRTHLVDELLGIANVPSAVWIDEEGVLVRPPEPSNILPSPLDRMDLDLASLPPARQEAIAEARKFNFEPKKYVAALRDWVENGASSRYALSPDEVLARSRPRPLEEATAAAHFELGEHLREQGDIECSQQHWREAHRLAPQNWTYKRQAWELIDSVDAGMQHDVKHIYESNWLDDVKRFGAENYYPRLEL
jgi:hypothetical protein